MENDLLFKQVFDSNKDRIYRICCCYVRNKEAREDVYQEVLIRIWRNIHTFQGKSQISTWIYRIAVNTCFRYLETENRRQKLFDEGLQKEHAELPDPSIGGKPDQDEKDIQRLYNCINQLPAIDRTLISLSLEDLSTKDIADVLGISEVNARVKLHRVRKTLKTMLERSEHGSR